MLRVLTGVHRPPRRALTEEAKREMNARLIERTNAERKTRLALGQHVSAFVLVDSQQGRVAIDPYSVPHLCVFLGDISEEGDEETRTHFCDACLDVATLKGWRVAFGVVEPRRGYAAVFY